MFYWLICLLLLSYLKYAWTDDKKVLRPIEELVNSRGYPIERVKIATRDDYTLLIHRMRHGKNSKGTNPKPILLQHGIKGSSATFMANPHGLAYHLADRGYDVWINNSRGNLYSKEHKTLNYKKDKSYWNFSFHEMGIFDLPAVLRYIKGETDKKTDYIGMSMGTTQLLVMGAEERDNLHMVDHIILMAPVARPKHMDIAKYNVKYYSVRGLLETMQLFGGRQIFKNHQRVSDFLYRRCAYRGWTGRLCEKLLTGKKGKDTYDFESAKENIPYDPVGTSIKVYKHFLQICSSGIFRQYDYKSKNKEHYNGNHSPPVYNLNNITPKIYLLAGGADTTAAIEDVIWLKERLPDAVVVTDKITQFTHRDFLFGKNLEGTLYEVIDNVLENN